MLKRMNRGGLALAGVMSVLMLAGCGNLSRVDDAGTASELVWPDADKVTFAKGSYPSRENLSRVVPGATKDQLYDLLGRPHFGEGLVGVREWDYLFHFHTPNGEVSCQYKVLFDKDKRARNFHWKPESCAQVARAR